MSIDTLRILVGFAFGSLIGSLAGQILFNLWYERKGKR